MASIANIYQKNFLLRYDFDPAIPYYKKEDFKGLKGDENVFTSTRYQEIHYFTYYREPVRFKKTFLFLPGIGPGHKAYLRTINELTTKGYKVITLDYEGCGYSTGNHLPSINQPTLDTIELLNHLKFKNEVVVIGHSLGAYTALNVVNRVNSIKKAIIISGFLNPKYGMIKFVKLPIFASKISKYEASLDNRFNDSMNLDYLKNTSDDIFFIHSIDDPKVSYKHLVPKVSKLHNPHLSFYIEEHKRHNPTYTIEAVKYKDKVLDKYFKLVKKEKLQSEEERKAYFKDISIDKMTEIDPVVINKIISFIG